MKPRLASINFFHGLPPRRIISDHVLAELGRNVQPNYALRHCARSLVMAAVGCLGCHCPGNLSKSSCDSRVGPDKHVIQVWMTSSLDTSVGICSKLNSKISWSRPKNYPTVPLTRKYFRFFPDSELCWNWDSNANVLSLNLILCWCWISRSLTAAASKKRKEN